MPPETSRSPSRRRVLGLLAAVGGTGLAGCFSPTGGPVRELSVYNATERSISVSLDVYRVSDDRLVVDEEFTLAPGNDRDYPDPFEKDGRKRIEVALGDGRRTSHEWHGSADADSDGLSVMLYDDEIDVASVVA